jgi:arginase family enzyme
VDERTKRIWEEAMSRPDWHMASVEGALLRPRIYADVPSFMEVPIAWKAEDLEGADVAFVGIPFESTFQLGPANWATFGPRPADPEAIISRSGSDESPEYIRKYSVHYSIHVGGGFYPEVAPDFRLVDHLTMVDYRDVEIKQWDVEETAQRAIDKVADIVRTGAIPLVFGGCHEIPYPVVRAISDNTPGKIGIILFDSHYDNDLGGMLNAGNAFGWIFETCQADTRNMVLIGIKGGAYNTPAMHQAALDVGFTVFTIDDVERMGIEEVTRRAIDIASRGAERVYVSLDADAMDPVSFPAQKYPDPFGLTARQVKTALGMIAETTSLAGFDLCTMGPVYDHKGVGALTACRLYLEILKGLALRKMRAN